MDSDDLLERAGHLVQSQHEAEILEYLGNALPLEARERFSDMVEFTRKELPSADRKLLPSAQAARASSTLGQRTLSAMKRVIWQSLCDKESAVYQAWSDKGLVYIVRLKFVAAAVSATLARMDIALAAIAVGLTALIIKMGLDTFCTALPPSWVVDA